MASGGVRLRERITFQRLGDFDDVYGNEKNGPWAVLEVDSGPLIVWADVQEQLGDERLAAGALAAPRMATIVVRRWAGTLSVTEADRIYARWVFWNIRSIAAVGQNSALIEFSCETGVAS